MNNNILIAQFMGYQVVVKPRVVNGKNYFEYLDDDTKKYTYCKSLLRYHDQWDWLMGVVEKIESTLDADGYRYIVEISNTLCIIWSDGDCVTSQMRGHEGLTKIDAVYAAVVEFIKAEKA